VSPAIDVKAVGSSDAGRSLWSLPTIRTKVHSPLPKTSEREPSFESWVGSHTFSVDTSLPKGFCRWPMDSPRIGTANAED